jgi:hypothetical protein
MPTRNIVDLDALLPREDLAAPAQSAADLEGLKLADLEPGLIYAFLRKPDFQRETTNWSPEQVADLIASFANGNIIPSIILWQSGQRVFVIDGAHRLSALVAWVRDDYGAGKLSIDRYENVIPEQQKEMHATTRALVHEKIGSYDEHRVAAQYPSTAKPDVLARATQFPFRRIDVQWIRNATPAQARDAFFRINQGGTKIDPVEIRILSANSSALAIGSRAISRGGTGHNYWDKFDLAVKTSIETVGAELHKMLFYPPLRQPIKTLDVPVAGFGYGSHVLPFSFDLVARTNDLTVADSTRRKPNSEQWPDDQEGKQTLNYLTRARDTIKLICSNYPSSLGLHPALYFYTSDGVFESAALFNAADWFTDLQRRGKLIDFLKIRRQFEALILKHPVIVKPPIHKLGSGVRTRARVVLLYERIFELLLTGSTPDNVWTTIIEEPMFLFLKPDEQEQKEMMASGGQGKPFNRRAKTAGYFVSALPAAVKCALCGGLLHVNSIHSDHAEEKSQGGSSAPENARPVHPICNSNRAVMGL